MPGLVEGHAHLFLNGDDLDPASRAEFLKAPLDTKMVAARRNLRQSLEKGITLIRDAGDKFGVNHALRGEAVASATPLPAVRSAGLGIRRPGRYGAFMAYEAKDDAEIETVVSRIAAEGADDLKIIQTGIIDFVSGRVKGDPQFDLPALSLIVSAAKQRGLKTFAHCSGRAGLEVAVRAGVDSIEHGFFMNRETLQRMADLGTAWVPTFSPVHFQWTEPQIAGWDDATVGKLRSILDDHLAQVALADELGVNLVAGSDAGSQGVSHGSGLIDELYFMLDAGVSVASVLESATSRPRRCWGTNATALRRGATADIVLLKGNPFQDASHLRDIVAVFKDGVPVVVGTNQASHHG
ncbi:MAG: amidohydrolase family protein [Proteobacteria bacterium]|nr:amidohydrolase family protein [Pseudomonadota bacterium]